MSIAPELRCPTCRSFDWYRDGFAMQECEDGSIVRRRLTDSADRDTPWSCTVCGFEVPPWTVLARELGRASREEGP